MRIITRYLGGKAKKTLLEQKYYVDTLITKEILPFIRLSLVMKTCIYCRVRPVQYRAVSSAWILWVGWKGGGGDAFVNELSFFNFIVFISNCDTVVRQTWYRNRLFLTIVKSFKMSVYTCKRRISVFFYLWAPLWLPKSS